MNRKGKSITEHKVIFLLNTLIKKLGGGQAHGEAWISSSSSNFNLVQKQVLSCHYVQRDRRKAVRVYWASSMYLAHRHGPFYSIPKTILWCQWLDLQWSHWGNRLPDSNQGIPFWCHSPKSAWLKDLTYLAPYPEELPLLIKGKSATALAGAENTNAPNKIT